MHNLPVNPDSFIGKTSRSRLAIPLAILLAAATVAGCASLARNGCAAEETAAKPFAIAGQTGGRIYFQENFQNYRDKAPTTVDDVGIEIGNDPIWTQSAEANVNLKASGPVLKKFSPSPQAALNLKNYDVLFKFRLRTGKNEVPGNFQLRLRNDLKGKTGDVIIDIAATDIKISSEGLAPAVGAAAKLPFEIAKWEWHTCAVTVRDRRLAVYIDDDRVMKQVATASVPALPSAGINFYGFAESPFSISNIVVRDPAPLPENTITNLLPAPAKMDASFKAGVSQTIAANELFGATVRPGLEKNAVTLSINWNDGKKSDLVFNVAGIQDERKVKKDGKEVTEKFERPDAIIQIGGISGAKSQLNYYIRPMLRRYHTSYSFTDTYHDIVRDWDLLPKASEHALKVECRATAKGVDLYLDSCYAGTIEGAGAKDATFILAPTAAIGSSFSMKALGASDKYLPLDVAALGMAKSFADAKPSLKAGPATVGGVPMLVAAGEGSADIGLVREGQGNWALEVDEYLARSPFDGLLTEVHFTVPGGAPYTKAWVLCAVDPDATKDPILTTRIAKYQGDGIGSNRLADTTTLLPRAGEKPGARMMPAGTVTKKDKNGKSIEVPLYLVEVPLNSGKILDLMGEPSLDLDFYGKPWENFEQIDNSMKPDPRSTSAVQIFGVTLEKSPVGLGFVQSQPANIFHNDEVPETTAVLTSFAAGKGKLGWDILDVDGKKVGTGSADYNFTKTGEEKKITIPLKMPQLGWYELRVSLQDEAGRAPLTHPASFALLGRDLRKAKYDSPYGTWWFDGAHLTPKELDFAGPVMFKAGIRKATWTGQTEKAMEKWFITKDQMTMPFKFDDLKNPAVALANAEVVTRKELEKYPHMNGVLIYHESGPGNDLPLELFGVKPTLTEAQVAREKRYADLLNMAGAFYRDKFPQLKLIVGNNSSSQSVMAAILRNGGKPEYIDYIGMEAPSQVYTPEKLQEWANQGSHIAKETVKTLSGRDIPATGSYEFTYRSERDMGQQQQAEWYARDILISLANKFTRIGPGILFDTANSYHNGLWGASGILERGPYGYPKKSYVAYAALTNVLDQVTLRRQVPTGSTTVYAVEFDRADKKLASALWASRGDADFVIEFAGDTAVKVVDMYGRSKDLKTAGSKLTVHAGTSPAYTIADREIKSITLANRGFPKDEARAKLATVAAPLDKADGVTLEADHGLDTPLVAPLQTPVRQAGTFELRQVTDADRGDAIELELKTGKNKNLSKFVTEYATIRLKTPAPVTGKPQALGVWVKGNSNWGRVMFEIEDADGEIWRSIGTGGWGCDVLDWPGNLAVNFDGWNFISLPLRDSKLFNDHSPGPVLEQWVSGGGNKQINYPIKVRALTVEMNRTPLDLVDFKTATPVIRIKDVSGIEEK